MSDVEIQTGMELVKVIGFPALIFFIWFLYHRSESQKWEKLIETYSANQEQQLKFMQNILTQSNTESERIYQLLRDSIEVGNHHSSILSRMEQKIDRNQSCPIVREKN